MSNKTVFLTTLITLCLIQSCIKENPKGNESGYLHGGYITNEGAFGNSNGSVSYYDADSSLVVNHVFELINGRPLGDVVQSMAVDGERGFIVVNNSQKMEVVDLETFESVGIIDDLEYPRYFLPVSTDKGYLTDGNYEGRVYVVDTKNCVITDTIPCGNGPEHLLKYGHKVLVANSGGWGNDSTITVIDSRKDEVVTTWSTGFNPTDMVFDNQDNLWVLCKGKVGWDGWTLVLETSSSIEVIDPDNGSLIRTIPIGVVGDYFWPQSIMTSSDGKIIYYLESGGIYSVPREAEEASNIPLISRTFYGMGVDPKTGLIYGLCAPSFTASGWLIRYSTGGVPLDSTEVGIGPNRIVFN